MTGRSEAKDHCPARSPGGEQGSTTGQTAGAATLDDEGPAPIGADPYSNTHSLIGANQA